MVKIHLAHTSPINPPNATPVLTVPQIWAALQRKIKYAGEFVPVIERVDILDEKDGVVTRKVTFQEGKSPLGDVHVIKEVITSYEPCWIDFRQDDGTVVRNVLASGSTDSPEDLYMTYVFEYNYPNVEEGSEEAEKWRVHLKQMAKKAVEGSIITTREMVKDGRIA